MRLLIQFVALGLVTSSVASANYTWKLEDVDGVGTGSRTVEVKTTADGRVHMAYAGCGKSNCNPQTALKYAVRHPNGAWERTLIDDSAEDVGRHAGLEIESNGTSHILYLDHTNVLLKWATRKPGSTKWATKRVSPKYGGYWASSAMHNDVLYVAHTRFNKTQLRENFLELGTYRNGKWSFEVMEPGGWSTALATQANGDVVIGSHDGPYFRGDTHLNYQENGIWKRQAIDGLSTKISVAVDSKRFIHVVYGKADENSDGQADDVMYATNAPDGKWKREILAGNNSPKDDAFFPAIAIDKDDTVHVSYRNYEQNALAYARKPLDGKWEHTLIEDMGRPLYSKLFVGPEGKLHIAIENSNRLYYGVCENCTSAR